MMDATKQRSLECAYDYFYALKRHADALELVDRYIPGAIRDQIQNAVTLARRWWRYAPENDLTFVVERALSGKPAPWQEARA